MLPDPTHERIQSITDEVNELHPLLQKLFEKHPKLSRVEYTHGNSEMGADFVLTRTHDVLGTTEYIGVVAKRGKIQQDVSDIERQIDECSVPRKIDGGKKEVVLSEVWVVCTGQISKNAQEKINRDHKGTKVHFIDVRILSRMVDEHIPYYVSPVDLHVGTYLSEVKSWSEQLDKTLDLMQVADDSLYISQDVVRVNIDPYKKEKQRKQRHKKVEILEELKNKKLLLVEAGMGGGKSKLLRYLTQHYANQSVFVDEQMLPVNTSFRDFVEEHQGSLSSLVETKVPGETRESAGQEVKYLILVDGLDEKNLPPEELSEIIANVAGEVEEADQYKLVLTSRHISSFDFDRSFLNRLERYEISPLSMKKIVDFLNAVCRRLNLHTRVIEDLQRSPLFDKLPKSPIAAVLLGQLLSQRQQELPSTMTELYARYIDFALGGWDMAKGLQSQQEFEALGNVLTELASYMLENEIEIVSADEVRERFREYLHERNLTVKEEDLVERAIEKAEILAVSRDDASIWFKHRSFAEFLYAKRLSSEGNLKASNKAFEPYWANTYFFGLGLRKDAPTLLSELIHLEPEHESHRWMKVIALAEFFMAAYATPYRVIKEGVHTAVLEAASLFTEVVEGKVRAPLAKLTRIQLLDLPRFGRHVFLTQQPLLVV